MEMQRKCLSSLPRRPQRQSRKKEAERGVQPLPPMLSPPLARASILRTALRFLRWMLALLRLGFMLLWDRLAGRSSPQSRGVRLRELFESMGGTAIKVGQQLAVRIDLLPGPICDELTKLMDSVPPFELRYAIQKIEEQCQCSLDDVFESFDPKPIGSASIACVYQARLKTGEMVAIKVQRPHVARQFATDLRAIDWMTYIPEALTLVKPGFFKYLRIELRSMFTEELDFRDEARYQRLFRKMVRRDRIKWLSAPRVFSQYSGREVLVSEFVSGIWCKELLVAVEDKDEILLAQLAEQGITPEEVGLRLLLTNTYGMLEALFFHADPHPANIIVQPGGRLIMLDFGSCGFIPGTMRRNMRAMMEQLVVRDVSSTVDAAIQLLTPVPRLDLYDLRKRMEATYERYLLALEDETAAWWERTTVGLWVALLQVTRALNIPVNRDLMRYFRASLLYDTLAFRLCGTLKFRKTFRRFERDEAKRAVHRMGRQINKASMKEVRNRGIKAVGEGIQRARHGAWQAELALSNLPVQFSSAINKGAYVAQVLSSFLIKATALAGIATVGIIVHLRYRHKGIDSELWRLLWERVLTRPIFLVPIAFLALLALRRILFRITEIDPEDTRRGLS